MQIFDDVVQGTEKWHDLRLGKITGSCFYKLIGTAAAAKKYLYQKASEIITKTLPDSVVFNSVHIQRGLDYESVAKDEYTLSTFTAVKDVGIIILHKYVSCSPDGLVGEDGMIEIKVPDSHNFLEQVLEISANGEKAINPEHYAQIQFNLYVTKRKWCDYILYNPKYSKEGRNNGLFIYRVNIDESMQKQIDRIVETSVEKIEHYVNQYLELNN